MPTYGYRCTHCDHAFEVVQKITDEPLTECEKCKGEVKRQLYPVGIVFKGSGFHVNDYRKSQKTDGDGQKEPKSEAEAPKKPTETATSSK